MITFHKIANGIAVFLDDRVIVGAELRELVVKLNSEDCEDIRTQLFEVLTDRSWVHNSRF